MKKNEGKLITVGVLAQKFGVTVRTLQYYDTNGLLIPSKHSEGGRRMYNRHDVIRLQQIVFLKSLGFSLDKIRDRLLPTETAGELEQVFKQQKEVLTSQILHIQEAVNLMTKVINEIKLGSEIDMDTLFTIMEAIKIGNPYSFMIRHFSKDQIENLSSCFGNEETKVEFNKSAQALFAKLIELYNQKEDPEGIKGQKLAGRWWNLVILFTKGDPKLIENMFELGANEDNWPSDFKNLKEATNLFLGVALNTYLKNNNIKLPFMEGR